MKNVSFSSYKLTLFVLVISFMLSCQKAGVNNPGSEYMPDMAHSVAYEANYYSYYYNNRWGTKDEYHALVQPRKPITGTIARGYAGSIENANGTSSISHTPNGAVPYYYGDSEEERARATTEIVDNPYAITNEGMARAKDLYNIYCGICHGEKGDGAGYLVRDDGGKYPVQPANLLLPEFVEASNGRYYHVLMHGKNKMGAYADKLSFEERWQVIHYVRSLQAKELKREYNQLVNTLNTIDRPANGSNQTDADPSMTAITRGE